MPMPSSRIVAPFVGALLTTGLVLGGYGQVERQKSSQAVIQALMTHNPAVLQTVLDQGGDANSTDEFGSTVAEPWEQALILFHLKNNGFFVPALSLAAETHDLVPVQILLAHQADPNARDSGGQTPIMGLVGSWMDPSNVYVVSRNGLRRAKPVWAVANDQKDLAACAGILTALTAAKGNVNATTEDGMTALMLASSQHKGRMVKLLLAHGADINIRNRTGETALSLAVTDASDVGAAETIRLLLTRGANPNVKTPAGGSLLQQASEWITPSVALLLLQYGADPNVRSPANGMTTLIQAARQGQYAVAKMALDKGADPNILAEDNGTALFLAIIQHHPNIVKLLLDRGADPNLGYSDGTTPLMMAAAQHDSLTVGLLLAHGADVNRKDPHDDNALLSDARSELGADYGRHHHFYDPSDIGHWQITWPTGKPVPTATAALLMSHGADVNASDQWGNTALSLARASGKTALVTLLQAHGANR